MPKIPPKKKKVPERSEEAVEVTLNLRVNSTGAQVVYECGNLDCTEQIGETEEFDFDKKGQIAVEATEEEVTCEKCGKPNFSQGFTISKL